MLTPIQSREVWLTTIRMRATPRMPSMKWRRPATGAAGGSGRVAALATLLDDSPLLDEAVRPYRHLVVIGGGHADELEGGRGEARHPARHALHALIHELVGAIEGRAEEREGLGVLSPATHDAAVDEPRTVRHRLHVPLDRKLGLPARHERGEGRVGRDLVRARARGDQHRDDSEATQGAEESGRVHAFDRLLGATAARDVPDGFHLLAAHHVDAVVEVDGGIAVRREELDELAEGGQPSRLRYGEAPVLVARPGVGDSGTFERLGHERLVGGEGLEPTV